MASGQAATAQAGHGHQAGRSYAVREQRGLEMLSWPVFGGQAVDALVTTTRGGVSAGPYASLNLGLHVGDEPAAVLENRRRVAAALGTGLDHFVFAQQTHGRRARVVSAGDRGRGTLRLDDAIGDTDALVTADPGTVLAVLVADCVPLVLFDPAAHVLACVHAGWRGTVARVAEAAVAAMRSLGARPENMLAGLGPAIGPDDYQVGDEVAAAANGCFGGGAAGIVRPDGPGRWLLDLWAANRRILAEAGVPEGQIQVAAVSTGDASGLFFSDRRARPCGRFATIARLRD